ncbi:MAG TPA: hypothetical protein VG889_18705 [Rhizomicrobium sp.]|nr:hypothetical protein [Rhizomicrobium sp.]
MTIQKISFGRAPDLASTLFAPSPLLSSAVHQSEIATSQAEAARLGFLQTSGPSISALLQPIGGVFTLAQYQSPFKTQGNRGTCWAFAGAAALEAAYRRKFGVLIDVSEEYLFHMGKSFALNRNVDQTVVTPVENNSSLTGFQGCGDIVKKLSENAVPPESTAPYFSSQQSLLAILPELGFANQAAMASQEDYDSVEYCEQHIPLIARVNARYRATGFQCLGADPSIQALENTLLSEHEIVCDVQRPDGIGGHVLLLIGFDRNRRVFFAKNHWGENRFIEIKYENDPDWVIKSGWYIEDVVDSTFVQNQACWLGNWWVNLGAGPFRILLRRSEDFAAPRAPTRLGSAYLGDGRHDINGLFLNNGGDIRLFIAPTTAPTTPGTLSGTEIEARLDFTDIYNAGGVSSGRPATLSRFSTRFAALFKRNDGTAWEARHGIDAVAYQATFNSLVSHGFRLTNVCGYSEGRESRFNAIWEKRGGPAWEARHGLTAAQYQTEFNALVRRGFRLVNVSGYAEDGQARYAGIWEQREGNDWQARHGMSAAQYQQTFEQLTAQGYTPLQVCAYRVDVEVLFAAIWEKQSGVYWEAHHAMTASIYQIIFDQQVSAGRRLAWVNGYSDTGIARYAAIWRQDEYGAWQARHGLRSDEYQLAFDDLVGQDFRPVQVSGYGDGFYRA